MILTTGVAKKIEATEIGIIEIIIIFILDLTELVNFFWLFSALNLDNIGYITDTIEAVNVPVTKPFNLSA